MSWNDWNNTIIGVLSSIFSGVVILYVEYKFFQSTTAGGATTGGATTGRRLVRPRSVIIAAIVAVPLGLFVYHNLPKQPGNITITSLRDKSTISQKITVKGTHQNIYHDTDIWVVVTPANKKQYVAFKALKYADGSWEARDIIVGLPESSGQAFEIVAVSSDRDASTKLENNSGNLISLPEGTFPFHTVTVFRE